MKISPIKETPADWAALEEEIRAIFKREIYIPLIEELNRPRKVLTNSTNDLLDAIATGKISYYRGKFTGQLNSTLSRELRRIGAEWDGKQGCFLIPQSKLSVIVRHAISISESRFRFAAQKIDKRLTSMNPEEIAGKLKVEKFFDRTIYKTSKSIDSRISKITVSPELNQDQRRRIAQEYTSNLHLYIKDFVQKETEELRKKIQENVAQGIRYEGMVEEIKKSYGVSERKAKFLARQETSLLMTKFQQVRYQEVGSETYVWKCVVGSPNHPVRPFHKKNDGKTFRWDYGAIVDEQGNRKNPGQDYNCRCMAIPIIKF